MQVVELGAFEQKVVMTEARGGPAADVMLVVPSVTRVGQPFEIGVSILDRHRQPCCRGTSVLTLSARPALDREATLRFEKGGAASCRLQWGCINCEGIFRLQADYEGRTFYSNPTLCSARAQRRVFWGDPHIHTVLSDCHADRCRSPSLACVVARHIYFLDWITLADHVSNGRGSPGKWKAMWSAVGLYDAPPSFAMLPGYEASLQGGCGGDNNVYLLDDLAAFVDEYEAGDVSSLAAKLEGVRSLIVPHHTSRPGKHGCIPREIYPGADVMPVVEIHSKWGTSEFRGNPNPLKRGVHDGPCFVQDLLAQGYHFGFIGGTDTHTTLTFGQDESPHIDRLPGITAIRSAGLSRAGIFGALKERNCYAASGQRILLAVTVAGRRMGSELRGSQCKLPGTRRIRVSAAARDDLATIDVVRNGEVIRQFKPGTWLTTINVVDAEELTTVALTGEDGVRFVYYYVRATTTTGAQAWSSPVRFVLD